MSDGYIYLKFSSGQGKVKYNKIDKRDLYRFQVQLLEESRARDLGDIFMRENSTQEWSKIDYYDIEV